MTEPLYASTLRSWREERGILRFVDENFKVRLDTWQEQALLAFASPLPEHRRISLQACVGPGKTAVLAMGGWWFISVQGDEHEHPKGIVTAITKDNLRDNLWAEYAKWQGHSEYLKLAFTWTSQRISSNDHPNTWFLSARTWPKTATPDEQGATFSGLHSRYPLAQIDESGAIPPTILRAAEQALSVCSFGKIMQAGNPLSREGMLFAAAYPLRAHWFVIRVTGNPKDPNAWVYSPRVGAGPLKWVTEQIELYGEDNPWVKSYIMGEFPPSSINSLFDVEDIERSLARIITHDQYLWTQKRLGVDVARFGDDRTTICPRQGAKMFQPVVMRNADTAQIAARVANSRQKWAAKPGGDVLILVDDTGHWGHGVLDQLNVSGHNTHPIVYHAKAMHPRYKNRRAEMYLTFAEWVKKTGALPLHGAEELPGELAAVTYTYNGGQFQIEEKEHIKLKLGRSPDLADGYAQTFALPDMPNELEHHQLGQARNHARTMDDQELEVLRAAARGQASTLDRDEHGF